MTILHGCLRDIKLKRYAFLLHNGNPNFAVTVNSAAFVYTSQQIANHTIWRNRVALLLKRNDHLLMEGLKEGVFSMGTENRVNGWIGSNRLGLAGHAGSLC